MSNIQVIGIKFVKSNQYGDFNWMSEQYKYSDSLFIFNDNEEYHDTCRSGAGNAIMRIYNKYSKLDKPKSAGIPTGTLEFGGYQSLNSATKKQIDNSFEEIIELIDIYKYKQIYYSSELDGKVGTSIFNVDNKVIRYITHKLFTLTINPVQIVKVLPNDFFEDDFFEDDFKIDDNNSNNSDSDNDDKN